MKTSRTREETLAVYADFIESNLGQTIYLQHELALAKVGQNVNAWVKAGVAKPKGNSRYEIVSTNPRRDAMRVLKERAEYNSKRKTRKQPDLFSKAVVKPVEVVTETAKTRKVVSILWGLVRIES